MAMSILFKIIIFYKISGLNKIDLIGVVAQNVSGFN